MVRLATSTVLHASVLPLLVITMNLMMLVMQNPRGISRPWRYKHYLLHDS